LRILLLSSQEPSDLAGERWSHLSRSFREQGLGLVSVAVQAGRKPDLGALREARALHVQQAFDLVISSGPPISAHMTAQAFSRAARISWVADWVAPLLESHKMTDWFDRRLEAKLVRAADRVLVSSEALARKYRALRDDHNASLRDDHNASLRDDHNASLLVVRNGFDRSELRSGGKRIKRDRLRIVCSQASDFDAIPFLETLNARVGLSEALEVVFAKASTELAGLVREFELESCVHCLDTNDTEAAALEVSADVLLTYGLNSAYRTPVGLTRVLARQRPILHVFESALDPSFEVFEGTPHLPSENNRFALTAALEAAAQGDWIVPNEISSVLSPEQYCWDAIAHSLVRFVCVAGSGSVRSGLIGPDSVGSSAVVSEDRQAVSGVTAKI
jgi:Glycosyl transferase 4-like domain